MLPPFAGRVLPFDPPRTRAGAAVMAKARSAGPGIASAQGYFGAIAASHGFAVAARNTGPFEAAAVSDINP